MLSSAARKPAALNSTAEAQSSVSVNRKIWLPKLIYDGLPYFYIAAGILALLATLYISEWFWVLPHYLLFAAACVHLGILVFRRRRHTGANERTVRDLTPQHDLEHPH